MPNKSSVCPHSIERQEMQRTVPLPFHFAYNKSYQDPLKSSPSDSNINSSRPLALLLETRPRAGRPLRKAEGLYHQPLPWAASPWPALGS